MSLLTQGGKIATTVVVVCVFGLSVHGRSAYAALQETVNLASDSQTVFNQSTTPLFAGTSADGDGDVLQLGYFSNSTANFSGTFIPLTGQGSLNTASIPGSSPSEPYNKTSIGDLTSQGGTTGAFFIPNLTFTVGSSTSGNNLPSPATQLAIRFYDGTSIATSTHYNTVTDSTWTWLPPSAPPTNPVVSMSLDDTPLTWESIVADNMAANTAFHTSISLTAVPEPSTWASAALVAGSLSLHFLRRRATR